jgi:hypothetical protein
VDTIPGEGPINGTVVINGDGTVTYNPDPNFAGVDSFMYVVCDMTMPTALCDTATVVITVLADPPVAINDSSTIFWNTTVTLLPLSNDTVGTNPIDPSSVDTIAGEGPVNGTVVINPDGTIDYTPDMNFTGVDSFMYVVCDSTQPVALCDIATVIINVVIDTPDVTPTITVLPTTGILGPTNMSVHVEIREVNLANTRSAIVVGIPKVSYLNFTYNPTLTAIPGGAAVENSKWVFSETPSLWIFTRSEVLPAGAASSFGFSGVFSSGAVGGDLNFSSIILNGSGQEDNYINNNDSETILFNQE